MHADAYRRILRRIEHDYETKCWVWPGSSSNGYGQISVGGRMQRTHRITYEHAKGPIPAGYEVDHRCENRACCNPDHLDAVTREENRRRYRHNHPLPIAQERHGTNAGYVAHYRRGQVPCQPCREARSVYERQRKERRALANTPIPITPTYQHSRSKAATL